MIKTLQADELVSMCFISYKFDCELALLSISAITGAIASVLFGDDLAGS